MDSSFNFFWLLDEWGFIHSYTFIYILKYGILEDGATNMHLNIHTNYDN